MLERPHRLVAAATKGLSKAKPDQNGLRWPGIHNGLEVNVSVAQIDRAMQILDVILKGVETAGQRVNVGGVGSPTKITFTIGGEEVRFRMRERVVKSDKPFNSKDSYRLMFYRNFYRPSGDLRFTIDHEYSFSTKVQWADTRRSPLESQVSEILEAILGASAVIKARRAEAKERNRLDELQAEQRRLIEVARRREREWEERLLEQSQEWDRVQVLRRFIEAARVQSAPRDQERRTDGAEEWIRRALAVVDRLDPMPQLLASFASNEVGNERAQVRPAQDRSP